MFVIGSIDILTTVDLIICKEQLGAIGLNVLTSLFHQKNEILQNREREESFGFKTCFTLRCP